MSPLLPKPPPSSPIFALPPPPVVAGLPSNLQRWLNKYIKSSELSHRPAIFKSLQVLISSGSSTARLPSNLNLPPFNVPPLSLKSSNHQCSTVSRRFLSQILVVQAPSYHIAVSLKMRQQPSVINTIKPSSRLATSGCQGSISHTSSRPSGDTSPAGRQLIRAGEMNLRRSSLCPPSPVDRSAVSYLVRRTTIIRPDPAISVGRQFPDGASHGDHIARTAFLVRVR
ncbi:hypothetical protein DFH06DRAFT_1121875 [Mycena polygramma]|nr:hypothetical protein DFH06DRAFT_1121875 [Mycena polygramma]